MNNTKKIAFALLLALSLTCTHAFAEDHNGLVFLVRHGEKASDAQDALLSAQGHRRAQCLAQTLGEASIREILVTSVARTQQTAEPLAKKLALKPTILEPYDFDAFVKQLHAVRNENVLVVGHADSVPQIIEKLGGGKIVIGNSDYDKLFVFHYDASGNSGSVVTIHYCDYR